VLDYRESKAKEPLVSNNLYYLSVHTLDSHTYGEARIKREILDRWLNTSMSVGSIKFDSAVNELTDAEIDARSLEVRLPWAL
jgi:hypothetical protein